MGYELIAYGIILLATAAITVYTMTHPPSVDGQSMKPADLESFSITHCDEGVVVPLIYGTVRIPGNILYYGNLRTKTSHADGPGQPIEGYKYWLDVWQSIGVGPLEILGAFINDKLAEVTSLPTYTPGETSPIGLTIDLTEDGRDQSFTYNPGDSAWFPSSVGTDAHAMTPVCHVFLEQWLMAMSNTFFPTIHWIVKHRFPEWFPITNAELSNGDNPAAIIYDLLLKSGETKIDLPSFQAAADYWETKGYGINIMYTEQSEVDSLIQKIFNYVDGTLRQKANGDWELITHSENDVSTGNEITTEDFIEFSLVRQSWDSVYNYFTANYSDSSAEYSRRTVRVSNSALIRMLGMRRVKTVDLTAFTDSNTASARLWELAKRLSYPIVAIAFKTNLKFAYLRVGDVVSITHSDYLISGAEFRITSVQIEDLDKNLVSFEVEQLLSTLFDNSFQVGGGTQQTPATVTPLPPAYQRLFEIPTSLGSYSEPAFLPLVARQGAEDGFVAYVSYDGGASYSAYQTIGMFALRGTLNHDYDSSHTSPSDTTPIDIAFYREDPEFESLSEGTVPYTQRFALIGNELLRFQTVSPGDNDNDLHLLLIERGCYGTPIEDHYQDSEVWLFSLNDSRILQNIVATSFHVKLVPFLGERSAAIGDCEALSYSLGSSSSISSSPSPSAAPPVGEGFTVSADFESGIVGNLAQGTSGFGAAGSDTKFSSDRAVSGSKSAKMQWHSGNEGWAVDQGEMYFSVTNGMQVWARGYFYFASPWSWGDPTFNKIYRLHVKSSGGDNRGYISIIGFQNSFYLSNEPAGPSSETLGTLDVDVWQCLELYVNFSDSSPIVRVWKNGILLLNDASHIVMNAPSDSMDFAYIMSTWNGGAPQNQVEYVDAFIITNVPPNKYDSSGNRMIGPIGW